MPHVVHGNGELCRLLTNDFTVYCKFNIYLTKLFFKNYFLPLTSDDLFCGLVLVKYYTC